MTKFMGSNIGGNVLGHARGQMGSEGGRAAQTPARLTINCVSSRENLVGTLPRTGGGVANLPTLVACESLASRLCSGRPAIHLAFLTPTSAKASTYFPYKSPHSLHGVNQIRVEVLASKCFHFHIL
jgi:hypothetical protein